MSERQATYRQATYQVNGRATVSDEEAVLLVVWRGWTEEERRKLKQQIAYTENRRKARLLFDKFRGDYKRVWRAYERVAEDLPFSARTVKRIVKGH